ncbi:hypothetical protein LAUMK35_05327 [Mycobacterium pseudokansasii]|uniref:Uncharacterized protein n=2 Tax=Mycobacterium pseudokansasii TaxID=2341080 RepID=A0A498QZ15_9MYCO|nr:hypothetical protein [Mycobacterium pseudokansasii]KZS69656.1 hypothetical protein A4G27_11450 [Mycobacterium kansasii]VBA32879.1 hypothetical protein LAUMK35_05327 [Mycobacterium pseudokansasii]VBA34499.1 hypothetical protein LAUMK21_05286 [Mycobacterium pseudokansasii]VBA55825.1 hypothetical protein LAUMK142_05273 [Mycobacterium pseudokansasii]
MDLDRITNPLRLAKGPHQPGTGTGCAMNVISYINGDARITDYPACSARPLAAFVQSCNDLLAGPGGYLTPENSIIALDLGWQTVGTAAVSSRVVHAWVAELLTSPTWGVVQYARITTVKAISDIAELHRRVSRGTMPTLASWHEARDIAIGEASTLVPASNPAGFYALQAAHQSAELIEGRRQASLDDVTGSALRAHMLGTGIDSPIRYALVTSEAIQSWRRLAGLPQAARAPRHQSAGGALARTDRHLARTSA